MLDEAVSKSVTKGNVIKNWEVPGVWSYCSTLVYTRVPLVNTKAFNQMVLNSH